MKYYGEVRWIIMLGFVKRVRFVDSGVKVDIIDLQIFTLLRLFT